MIRTLEANVAILGPVSVNRVEVTAPNNPHLVLSDDYEVSCSVCSDYLCTHLRLERANEELIEHATSQHGISLEDK